MGLRTQIDTYNEKMLKLQFEASNDIEHKGTKGELREKFLKRFFESELKELNIKNSVLSKAWMGRRYYFYSHL